MMCYMKSKTICYLIQNLKQYLFNQMIYVDRHQKFQISDLIGISNNLSSPLKQLIC